jgi:hypothetical protein
MGVWIRDPRSRKNLFRIPDPGVKKAPGSQICNTGKYCKIFIKRYRYLDSESGKEPGSMY